MIREQINENGSIFHRNAMKDHLNLISPQCAAVGFFEHSQHVFKPLPFLLPSPSPPEPSLPLDRNVQRERYVKEHYYTVHGIRESPQKNLLVVGCYNDLDSLVSEDVLCPKSWHINHNQSMTFNVRLQLVVVWYVVASCNLRVKPIFVVTCDVCACGAF